MKNKHLVTLLNLNNTFETTIINKETCVHYFDDIRAYLQRFRFYYISQRNSCLDI